MSELLSPSQRRILEWLRAYPGVKLNAAPGAWIMWTAMWADEQARRNMVEVLGEAFKVDLRHTAPKTLAFLDWGTPRCSRPTFQHLLRHGYLRKVGQASNDPMHGYFSISPAGLAALEADEQAGIEVQLPTPRPMQHCECGWQGRAIGGHRSGPRHRQYLLLVEYRRKVLEDNRLLGVSS